jgi:hypothetical protein
MSELIILTKKDLEKMFKDFLDEVRSAKSLIVDQNENDKMNQRSAAKFLGITEATLIRWKKKGLVPYDQLPGSTKVTFYKSQLRAVVQRNPKLLQAPRK